SIYPAAIAHSALNNGCNYSTLAVVRGIAEDTKQTLSMSIVIFSLTGILFAMFAVFMIKDSRKKTA
nr:hypothetical protein [Ruminococcus sp.]